jgi:hypothetical protein
VNFKTEIDWSRQILRTVRNVAFATVNANLTPHQTVLANGFVSGQDLQFYWWSFPTDIHSENVRRTGIAEIAVYRSDSPQNSLRLIVQARELDPSSTPEALAILNTTRRRHGIDERLEDEFVGPHPKRLYLATPYDISVPVRRLSGGQHTGDTHAQLPMTVLLGFEAG